METQPDFKKTYFERFRVFIPPVTRQKRRRRYYWLMGRIDDVIQVSGHRIGTAEVESAFVSHPKVAEAAVVGMPTRLKGEGIYAFLP